MIRQNELRIGNIIQFDDESNEIVKVEEIYKTHPHPVYFIEWNLVKGNKKSYKEGNSTIDGFRPVLLTQEILNQCGFEILSNLDNYIVYKLPGSTHLDDKGCFSKEERWFKINSIAKQVYYLHELQNAYFVLTGEELPINL